MHVTIPKLITTIYKTPSLSIYYNVPNNSQAVHYQKPLIESDECEMCGRTEVGRGRRKRETSRHWTQASSGRR